MDRTGRKKCGQNWEGKMWTGLGDKSVKMKGRKCKVLKVKMSFGICGLVGVLVGKVW